MDDEVQPQDPDGIEATAEEVTEQISADVGEAVSTVNELVNGTIALLPKIGIAVVVFLLFLVVAWLLELGIRRWTGKHPSKSLGLVLGRLGRWAAIILGLMVGVAIVAPSVTPAKLLSGLGIGGVAIGFAFKDILQNFLAGILILLRQPFKIGDIVRFDDHEGTVQNIDTRLTEIKTYDGRQVLVPNGEIYTNPIVVITAYEHRRREYDIGIGYADDIGEACEHILKAMQDSDGVMSEPSPDVLVQELAGSTVNIRARWWTKPHDYFPVGSRVIKAIKESLDDAAIDMPFPTQVMLFHDQTEETDGDRTKQREGWPAGDAPPKPRRLQQANGFASESSKE